MPNERLERVNIREKEDQRPKECSLELVESVSVSVVKCVVIMVIETAGVEHEGWENKGLERSFTDRNNLRKSEMYGGFVTEKKDMSYSRVDHETSQQKMRLRDRLDQV